VREVLCGVQRKRFDHDDDDYAMLFASQHESRQTRIGPLDSYRVLDGRLACPGGRCGTLNETPVTRRATGIDWFGETWVAAECRRGLAPVRIVRPAMANPAAMPGLPESPATKLGIKPKPATHRRIKLPLPEGSLPHCKNSLAEPVAILENATLSVLANIIDMDEVSGIKIVR
jgi:hypothetical protein